MSKKEQIETISLKDETCANINEEDGGKDSTETSIPNELEAVRIYEPSPNDVLLGRGSGVNNHHGNQVFRTLVQEQKEQYNQSKSKVEKKAIAVEIVKTVQSSDGRFLFRPSNSFWMEVSFQKAILKASQALREGAPTIRKMLEDSNDSSASNSSITSTKNDGNAAKKAKTSSHINAPKHSLTTPKVENAKIKKKIDWQCDFSAPSSALNPRMSLMQSEPTLSDATPSLLGSRNFHKNFAETMTSSLGIEKSGTKWHAFPDDPLADVIFNMLSQQPTLTPFGRFLQDMLLPQQNCATNNLFHPQWRIPKKVGDIIPHDIIFKMLNLKSTTDYFWTDVRTKELFENKRVVLFACPAAFNKSCTESHVPEYQQAYDEIISNNIDDVFCVSVNDSLVMNQWFKAMNFIESQDIESQERGIPHVFSKVKILPDGTGHFTKMMGMCCTWDLNHGFGDRSWRYSAVINNLKIEQLFMEGNGALTPNVNIPIIVSDAHTMLKYLRSITAENLASPAVKSNYIKTGTTANVNVPALMEYTETNKSLLIRRNQKNAATATNTNNDQKQDPASNAYRDRSTDYFNDGMLNIAEKNDKQKDSSNIKKPAQSECTNTKEYLPIKSE